MGSLKNQDEGQDPDSDQDNMLGNKVGADVNDYLMRNEWGPKRQAWNSESNADSNSLINNFVVYEILNAGSSNDPSSHESVSGAIQQPDLPHFNDENPSHASPTTLTNTIPRPTESIPQPVDQVTYSTSEADESNEDSNLQAKQLILDMLYNLMLRELEQKLQHEHKSEKHHPLSGDDVRKALDLLQTSSVSRTLSKQAGVRKEMQHIFQTHILIIS